MYTVKDKKEPPPLFPGLQCPNSNLVHAFRQFAMQAMKLMLDKYSLECSPTLLENKIADLNRMLLMNWSFTGVYSGTRDIFYCIGSIRFCAQR